MKSIEIGERRGQIPGKKYCPLRLGFRRLKLSDLLTHRTRDARDGRLHFRHHALGFFDALHAALAESFLLGHGANLLDVPLDTRGDEVAVSAHPALQIDKMVVVT